jgi:LacI family transcriptional regulator
MYGTEVSSLVRPSITSIEKPVRKMAEEAVRLILRQISYPATPVQDIIIPSEVVVRDSSRALPI